MLHVTDVFSKIGTFLKPKAHVKSIISNGPKLLPCTVIVLFPMTVPSEGSICINIGSLTISNITERGVKSIAFNDTRT